MVRHRRAGDDEAANVQTGEAIMHTPTAITGFMADGDCSDGVLYHAGMVLYRESAGYWTVT